MTDREASAATSRTSYGTLPLAYTPADQRALILRLAWPAILEMVLHMFVWIVDTAMVGRLGAAALSAVGLGGQVCWTVMWFIGSMSTGITVTVAQSLGAQQPRTAARQATTGLALSLAGSLVVMALLIPCAPWVFRAARAEPPVPELGIAYMRILTLAAPFMLFMMAGNAILRAGGDTRTPLLVTALTNALNVVGDYVLIFGKLGLPALGVEGAAWAAFGGHVVGAAVLASVLQGGRVAQVINLRARPSMAHARDLLRLSLPAGLEGLLMDGARTVSMFLIARLGTVPFAAHQVTAAAESLSFMPGHGFAVAATVLMGQYQGAGEQELGRRATWQAAALAAGIMAAIASSFLLFPTALVSMFTPDRAVVTIAARCLRIAGLMQPLIGVLGVLSGSLRGAGDTRTPMLISSVVSWAVRLPLVYLVVMTHPTLTAVWWAILCQEVARAAATTWVFVRRYRPR